MAILQNTAKRLKPKERFNWIVSDIYRRFEVLKLEWQTKLTGRGYYCTALHGESEYNITINSDRTVSCNCQDYEGLGHIGDLRKNSFEEIFHCSVAQNLRDDLAKCIMPIPNCVRCGDV